MLEKARQQVEAEGQRGHDTRYLQAELEDLSEIETESLDFATAQGDPLSFCRDPGKAVRELRRVLKPGACVVLSVDSRVAGLRSLQGQASPHESLELLRTGRTQWFAKRSEEAFPMKMFDTDELHALLSRGGFEVLSTIAKTCIVQRNNEAWLEDPKLRLRLLRAEERVHGRPSYFGLAGHLQVAAQRRR